MKVSQIPNFNASHSKKNPQTFGNNPELMVRVSKAVSTNSKNHINLGMFLNPEQIREFEALKNVFIPVTKAMDLKFNKAGDMYNSLKKVVSETING